MWRIYLFGILKKKQRVSERDKVDHRIHCLCLCFQGSRLDEQRCSLPAPLKVRPVKSLFSPKLLECQITADQTCSAHLGTDRGQTSNNKTSWCSRGWSCAAEIESILPCFKFQWFQEMFIIINSLDLHYVLNGIQCRSCSISEATLRSFQ